MEYAYNDSMQASTGVTPFYALYGRHPYSPLSLWFSPARKLEEKESVTAFAERMQHLYRQVRLAILKAQMRQAAYANRKRRDHEFKVGDLVWLSAEFRRSHVAVLNAKPKLNPSWLGPFPIKRVISRVAYELALPKAYQKIHPVVHVSFLKEHQDGKEKFPGRPGRVPLPPELIQNEEHFWIDSLLNHRYVSYRGKRYLQWLVRWKGYGEASDDWSFDEDIKEDLDERTYARIRSEYEKVAKIPEGSDPPDDGKDQPEQQTEKKSQKKKQAGQKKPEKPVAEKAKPEKKKRAEKEQEENKMAKVGKPIATARQTRSTPSNARQTRSSLRRMG
jgi:hypothetical protein